jgi:hypothetical protein
MDSEDVIRGERFPDRIRRPRRRREQQQQSNRRRRMSWLHYCDIPF